MATCLTFNGPVRSKSQDAPTADLPSPRGLPSPRVLHFDGEIPPTMSPLDAFAAQSRLLAKQLDESKTNGRRVSRLPPCTIASSLANPRPGYIRSKSVATGTNGLGIKARSRDEESSGNRTEVEEPLFRPKSFYPQMSSVLPNKPVNSASASPNNPRFATSVEQQPSGAGGYFGIPQAHSPEHEASIISSESANERPSWIQPQYGFDSADQKKESHVDLPTEFSSSRDYNINALVPPRSPKLRSTGSIRSVPADSSDDEQSASTSGSSISQHRKLSSSSGMSMPHSPPSTFISPHVRTPSVSSECSIGGTRKDRPCGPTFNFSRPMSRGSRPSLDLVSRQSSTDSQPFVFTNDTAHTPLSRENEDILDSNGQRLTAAPSYIYAKFSLPRGRILQRDSAVLENTEIEPQQPIPQSSFTPATPPAEARPESPATLSVSVVDSRTVPSRPSEEPLVEQSLSKLIRPPPTPILNGPQHQSSASLNSGSTVRAYSSRTVGASTEVTAEDHLAKGIECHERGSLNESTYHLRIAAKQNHPTAMLLYALACRHGWGMRPNQQEGVQWLRRAADSASLEIIEDEDSLKETKLADLAGRKTRRAHFALSIYELGVSHMNGWGIEQEKTLALRCFEIASNWGDADAMAEAGFCYAQGVGCKKDLKKAAKYYRMAEAKGMSMVGNSWYINL